MNGLLISFFLILFTSIGVGYLFQRLLNEKHPFLIGEAGLWGLLICGVLGNVLHFFIPISFFVSSAFGFIGIGYLSYIISKQKINKKNILKLLLFAIPLLIYVVFNLYYSVITYDTVLYHLQTIKWNISEVLPFGLANLHDRFGFNSLWFMSVSILHFHPSSPFVINGVLFFLFLGYLLQQIILLSNNKLLRSLVFLPIGFLFILIYSNYFFSTSIFGNNIFTSPATDFASTIFFCFLIFSYITSLIKNEKLNSRLVLLAGILITIKLSYLPIFIFLLIHYIWQKRKDNFFYFFKNKHIIILIFSFIIWVIRSIFLSGCLVFPVVNTCLSIFPWSVPLKNVAETSAIIMHWAQTPGNLDPAFHTGFKWLNSWINSNLHQSYIHQIIYLLLLFGALEIYSYFFTPHIYKNDRGILKIQFLLLLFFMFASIYWFMLGPDIRFIQGYFIGVVYIIALPFLFYLGRYFKEINVSNIAYLLYLSLLFYFLFINRNEVLWMIKKGNQDKWPFIPKIELKYVVSPQGTKIYYPKTGDQCMDVDLICSNEKKTKLNIYRENNRLFFIEK